MNILTFDLEDWFHILDHESTALPSQWTGFENRLEKNTEKILALLDEKEQHATWFCLGWVAAKYPSLIRKIAEKHHIACHSQNHELLFRNSKEHAKNDIESSVKMLEDIIGKKVDTYRAPGFSVTEQTPWIFELLISLGIRTDCSVFPVSRNHGGFSSFPISSPCRVSTVLGNIYELPVSTGTFFGQKIVFSGGGYFRLFPYNTIKSMIKKSDYMMTYFHPRDFDPGQPVLKSLTLKRRFMSYTGLKSSFGKLNHLLDDFKFINVNDAIHTISWDKTPLIDVNSLISMQG
jgi:peptidoglycan-N-acetylglucosamine deacetylase